MYVDIWFDKSSHPITFDNAHVTYQKGDLFCVMYNIDGKQKVVKYPIDHIFCIRESEYPSSQPEKGGI